jgi:hypothetical protein
MDQLFFSKHLLTIARHTHSRILLKKEKLYYYRYIRKLSYHIKHLNRNNLTKAMEYVKAFECKEANRIQNGFWVRPRKVLFLACQDVKDVLKSMERWEGTGYETL